MVDDGGRAIAGLTGYVIGPEPEKIADDFPALFRSLQELENRALNSWYVNVLATYPEYRGKGMESRLLDLAEDIARSEGLERMSIIVAGNNTGARRFYERKGYSEIATAPSGKGDWTSEIEDWVLLVKAI